MLSVAQRVEKKKTVEGPVVTDSTVEVKLKPSWEGGKERGKEVRETKGKRD
jgi:hypothetical protein